MTNTVFIYALNCPFTGATRYVGKARDPIKRFGLHLHDRRQKNHRTNWISYLRSRGAKPVLEVLDEVAESDWRSWEVAWIAFFRERGFDLVNATPGGEGGNGVVWTAEARAKMSANRMGSKNPMFGRDQSGDKNPNFGKTPSEETRAKLRVASTGNKNGKGNTNWIGRKHSEKSKEKIRQAATNRRKLFGSQTSFFGKKHSVEARAKISKAGTGKKQSPQTIAKRVATMKARRVP